MNLGVLECTYDVLYQHERVEARLFGDSATGDRDGGDLINTIKLDKAFVLSFSCSPRLFGRRASPSISLFFHQNKGLPAFLAGIAKELTRVCCRRLLIKMIPSLVLHFSSHHDHPDLTLSVNLGCYFRRQSDARNLSVPSFLL